MLFFIRRTFLVAKPMPIALSKILAELKFGAAKLSVIQLNFVSLFSVFMAIPVCNTSCLGTEKL